ncbi:PfkB family carbohydrate kinase [Hydrogenoanaerobacterium sp.]|uniref:PfkB family carbohydrate kinase n=1 Tax=Hydrogenoanaerobacterium sp. TaxID=2953763 RepID=UPI00289AA072|nr:PfkB family carbohydrate kinase [Hydrogenoanaerobacterium sp.]
MKMIAVGDNVTDCYIDQKIYYPGGNAVNVAVNCKRNGFDEVAYIGVFGNDENATHIKWALDQEQVRYNHSRTICAQSGKPEVSLNEEGDRIFIGGPKNTAQHIVRLLLTPEDLLYIQGFDVCHTSCFSSIEPELAKMQKHCQISFDFSERKDINYLKTVCPHIRFAFFSGSDMTENEVYALMDTCHQLGTEIVGVTQGKQGAVFSHQGVRFHQGIKDTTVVDTMGAGDSFIAGFLTEFVRSEKMTQALDFAAECSAKTCTFYGGFGYPHQM